MSKTTPATKQAAKKTAPAKPSPTPALQNAIRKGDTPAVANLFVAQLQESNDLCESLMNIIRAQSKQIQSYRGLASLATGMGQR